MISVAQESQFVPIELTNEDLDLISGGVTITYTGNAGVATGIGGTTTINAAGEVTANAGLLGFAFTGRGPGTLTF